MTVDQNCEKKQLQEQKKLMKRALRSARAMRSSLKRSVWEAVGTISCSRENNAKKIIPMVRAVLKGVDAEYPGAFDRRLTLWMFVARSSSDPNCCHVFYLVRGIRQKFWGLIQDRFREEFGPTSIKIYDLRQVMKHFRDHNYFVDGLIAFGPLQLSSCWANK